MRVLVLLATLLAIAVASSNAQVADSLTLATLRPPLDFCALQKVAAANTGDILRRLNSGELSAAAPDGPDSLSIAKPVLRCENGPRRIIHTVHNEFHWPPIYRGSCDNLFCSDPPCFARTKVWVTKCVHVFKLVNGYWVYAGRQARRFLDHTRCGCKKCTDIYSRSQCVNTRPCPNSHTLNSFCYWTPFIFPIEITPVITQDAAPVAASAKFAPIPLPIPGRCRCCTPFYCPRPKIFVKERCRCECPRIRCPPGQIFNSVTCQCDCPKGSKKNSYGQCVGDCDDISVSSCRFVKCADNQNFQCKVENYKCVCPSCDDVTNTYQCTQTKCLEQRGKPKCKVDPYSHKCRCPRCEEQNDKPWCDMTYCGPNYHLQCRWNPYSHSCSCPH